MFWLGLGLSALIKGIGFGAALVGVTVALVLAWDRDLRTLRRLTLGRGRRSTGPWRVSWRWPGRSWCCSAIPRRLGFWTWHVAGRLAERPEHFASGPWWQYGPALLGQILPWTPLALVGAGVRWPGPSAAATIPPGRWRRRPPPLGLGGRSDRLALAGDGQERPLHHPRAAPLVDLGGLEPGAAGGPARARGVGRPRLRRGAWIGFAGLGLSWGLVFAVLGPWLDRRGQGAEWAFYEAAGRCLRPGEPLALLYDDWDRLPYPTPFGPIPHDLGVRLFYLRRPACWRFGVDALAEQPPASDRGAAFAVIGRDRDVPALRRLGRVETLARGPVGRARMSKVDDRTFRLYRVTPEPAPRGESVAVRR